MKHPKSFPSAESAYGMLKGMYNAYITTKAKLQSSYRFGSFFTDPDSLLLKIKELYNQGVAKNVYDNPILFLDQINKQGSPTDYFTHPNTANHMWSDLKKTVGDVEVVEVDFLNFVDPTISVRENWKQSIQAATGIKPANVDFVKLSTRHNVFAKATYRASGHLLKFEICLPGPVWHDVTFNHDIVEGIPVHIDLPLKAIGEMYDNLKLNLKEGEMNIEEMPNTASAQKHKMDFMKQTEKTFTLYGSLDSPYVSQLFNFLAIKYSDNVKWLLNPLTSTVNAIACLVMESFDRKTDGAKLNKSIGSDNISKYLLFTVIDSPELPSLTLHDFSSRSQFIDKISLYGFFPTWQGFRAAESSSYFDKSSLNGLCTFIAPESLLFGPVIEKEGHLKVIDTSITVTSKILDTFVFPKNMYESDKELASIVTSTSEELHENKQSLFKSRDRSNKYMFADTRTAYMPSSMDFTNHGFFEMFQVTQIIHDNPEYNVKTLRMSSGMMRNDITRHYPLTGAKVQVKLGTHAYHDSLAEMYKEAFLGSKDYDNISYTVIPEEDGRYLHGSVTPKTKCHCGLPLEDHKKTLCPFTESSSFVATGAEHKDLSVTFFETLRTLSNNGFVFNNALELKLIYCEIIFKDLIDNKIKYTTTVEGASMVVSMLINTTAVIEYPIRVTGCDEKVLKLCSATPYEDAFISLTESTLRLPSLKEMMSYTEDELLIAAALYTLPCYENDSVTLNITNTPLMLYLLKYGKDLTYSQYYHSPSNNQEALIKALKLMVVHDLNRFASINTSSELKNALYLGSSSSIVEMVSKIYDDFNSQPFYQL